MTKPEKIAGAEEVLAYLTARMRADAKGGAQADGGESKGPRRGSSDSGGIRAAELLAKHYGLLAERAAMMGELPCIIDDIAPADDEAGTQGEAGGAADG
ncbi:MAG: hypothetical protein FWE77_03845 [Clostridia bacterium]|nr:hypothetical protein [Clostridia bacterium]